MGGNVNSNGIEKLLGQPAIVNKIAIGLYEEFQKYPDWKIRAEALFFLGYAHHGHKGRGIGLDPPDEARILYCDLMESIGANPDVTSEVLTMALHRWGYVPREEVYGKLSRVTKDADREDKLEQPQIQQSDGGDQELPRV